MAKTVKPAGGKTLKKAGARVVKAKDTPGIAPNSAAAKPESKRSVTPPSVLPNISPSRGEIGSFGDSAVSATSKFGEAQGAGLISPLEGEMSGRTEGGAKGREPGAVAAATAATRRSAQAGRSYSATATRIEVLPAAERISLRAPAGSITSLSKALGVKLPDRPKTSAGKGGRTALWLGPDEWLVIDEAGGDPLADCAGVTQLHSAVGVSHRNVAFAVAGAGAEAALNAGCPQDLGLAAFPVGACSRTILGKIEVVLLRTGEDAFRVECWRSFSDYAFAFLSDAARDAAV